MVWSLIVDYQDEHFLIFRGKGKLSNETEHRVEPLGRVAMAAYIVVAYIIPS